MPSTLRDVPDDLLRAADRLGKAVGPKIRAAVLRAAREAGVVFRTALERSGAAEAVDDEEVWDAVTAVLAPLFLPDGPILEPMVGVGRATAKHVDIAWSAIDEQFRSRAAAWLAEHGAQLVTNVTAETRRALAETLQRSYTGPVSRRALARQLVELPSLGLDRQQSRHFENWLANFLADTSDPASDLFGLSAAQIQRRINQEYKRRLRARAIRIAATEGNNAANAASDLAIREAVGISEIDPAEMELEWVTRLINACPICEAMDSVRRPLVGGLFVSRPVASGKFAGQRLSFERPTAHPNCYCGVRTVPRDG